MNQKKKISRKVISYVLALVMVLSTMTGIVPGMGLTAYAAGEDITSNITIFVSDSCEDRDCTVSTYDKGEYTVKEGVVVTFECSKWWTETVTIYLNGTAVATWSGRDYDSKYVWTAKKDAKINWAGYKQESANIYLTETAQGPDKTALNNAITAAETLYNSIKDNNDYTEVANTLKTAAVA